MIDVNKIVSWNVAKKSVHDASGITVPELYKWYKENGVYYPIVDA